MENTLTLLFVLVVACTYGHAARLPPNHRIIGGVEVNITQHPYQLTLKHSEYHNCGASIISRKWAVTAAHCVGSVPYRVGAGCSYYKNTTLYNISQIVIHPNYQYSTGDYDIALIKIEDEFHYADNVQPIKLPERELQTDEIVNVTGWGMTEYTVEPWGEASEKLMRVTVPIVDYNSCKETYNGTYRSITERMICAGLFGIGGKDSCHGDSGGPLSANNTLYGIVSWSYGCAQPYFPGVYTNVANLRPWITSITGI